MWPVRSGWRAALAVLGVVLLAAACGGAGTSGTSGASGVAGHPPASSQPSQQASAPAPSTAGAASASGSAAPALTPVSVEIPNKGVAFTLFYVGRDLGIFRHYGLSLQIKPMAPPPALAALSKGEITFVSAIGSANAAALQGLPVKVVFVAADRPDFLLIGGKGYHSVAQLRGKTLAGFAARNTVDEVMVDLLRQHGVQPGQYHIVEAGPDANRAALVASGKAAATILEMSAAYKMTTRGYPVLGSAEQVVIPFTGLATTTAELRQHPGVVRAAVAASEKATAISAQDESSVVPVMMREFGLPAAAARTIFKQLQPTWTPSGRPSAATMQKGAQFLKETIPLSQPPDMSKLYDFSFLKPPSGGQG